VDITCTEWRSDRILLLAGHRRFETVVALYDVASETVTEVWSSAELSSGGFYVSVSGIGEKGDCVLVGESYTKPPEIATIRHGQYEAVRSFDPHCANPFRALNSASGVSWKAPDGLDIEGWLLSPRASAPHPLIMFAHGGPVWHWHPRWLGRWGVSALMLLKRGYALFYPNPRGSSGRGKGFIRPVYGDMGGNDARDLLAGVDSLIAGGVADAKRLGIMGNSYGGFMTSWLIGQDERFAAAVSISAHNNQVTEHLLSNIPEFMALLLQDHYNNPRSRYFERSPIMHAHKVRTPILNICGALDRCTPPEEAAQFHNAMRETGARSVLVTYPQEGHGVRRFPAVIDFTARIVSWFEEHIPADSPTAPHRGTLLRQ
jgi:dipeptidyl aminopeptidase/acylaminoacyl peptidase